MESDPTPPQIVDSDEVETSGLLAELNRQFLHPLGYQLTVYSLGDNRVLMMETLDDPSGILYETSAFDDRYRENASRLIARWNLTKVLRFMDLGFMVQPIPGLDDDYDRSPL